MSASDFRGEPERRSAPSRALAATIFTQRALVGYLCALIVGAVMVYSAFPLERVFPQHSLDFPIAGDAGQHVVGQRYFIADAWRWPLLRARNLGTPKGVDISLTDSIPLLAVPAKLLRGILPPGFHTIDMWLAIAFFLQPIAAVFALRSAGERRLAPALFVAVVALSVPSFLYRIGHAALTGHFLILLAIGFYFRILRDERGFVWKWQPLLMVVSLLIHPYLMVMVLAVLAAAPISLYARRDTAWKNAALGFGFSVGLTVLVMALLGYLSTRSPRDDFGTQQMNLLAPFHPTFSSLIPGFHFDGAGTAWTGEGYQYLGLGIIVLLCVSTALLLIRPARLTVRSQLGLVVISAALILIALSTKIYVGNYLVVAIKGSPHILEQMRSSGRFFWPVTYLILIGATVVAMRYLPAALSLPLLALAAALQVADTAGSEAGAPQRDARPSELDDRRRATSTAAGVRPSVDNLAAVRMRGRYRQSSFHAAVGSGVGISRRPSTRCTSLD